MEGLTNEELRKVLVSNGIKDPVVTDSTRGIYLRKLQKLKGGEVDSHSDTFQPTEAASSPAVQAADERTAEEGFYGICMSEECDTTDKALLSPCYYSKAEALKAVKNCPGARFKKFDSKSAAEAFSSSPLSVAPHTPQTPPVSEKPNSLPKLKQQELSALKNIIEASSVDEFVERVWSNPRYLITSGDAPEILQVAMRYNALHCAVVANQLEVCQRLVDIIQSDRFWEMVYPDDSEDIRAERCAHLLDLYLNLPVAKGCFNDTPLHLASKLGHKEIVSFLISLPAVRVNAKNGEGKTAAEVVCERAASKAHKESIKDLFEEVHYVSVIRAVDNSTPPYLDSSLNTSSPDFFQLQQDDSFKQAIAGPMSPVKAKSMYQQWKSPSRTKRADPERGMERVGREIAHKENVTWNEYWDFLGCYCDLSQPEGLNKLEQYLSRLFDEIHSLRHQPTICITPSRPQSEQRRETVSKSLEPDMNRNSGTGIDERQGKAPSSHIHPLGHTVGVASTDSDGANLPESDVSPLPLDLISPRPPPSSPFSSSLDGLQTSVRSRASRSGDVDVGEALLDALQKLEISAGDIERPVSGHDLRTPPNESVTPTRGTAQPVYLTGTEPTKLDLDVLLALCNVEIDSERYPCVDHWKRLVESHSQEEQSRYEPVTPPHLLDWKFVIAKDGMAVSS